MSNKNAVPRKSASMRISSIISFVNLYASVALADWQFRSRPDLSPPQLNITVAANKTSPGHLFVAPYSGYSDSSNLHGPRQAAPYIFTDTGDLVWSGYTYFSIWNANFQAAKFHGQDVLFSFEGDHNPLYGHGHGHFTFLNKNYETIKEIRAGNHRLSDKHEFHILDEKTAVIQIHQPTPFNLEEFGGGRRQQWIVNSIFQELDLETGRVLFEWSSLDHVSPHESVFSVNSGRTGSGYNSSDAWNYFHINSVDKDRDGNYLLSARICASIYKINGKTGEVMWKLGGIPGVTSSAFATENNLTFSFQHHARYLSTSGDKTKQVISLFDNSAHGTEDSYGDVKLNGISSAKIIEVDTQAWNATLLYNAPAPYNISVKSQGSAQVLPNNNVLVNWGSEGAVTEYDLEGNIVFHTFLDSGILGEKVENYRAFKFNWTGIPFEDIAVASQYTPDGFTNVYVSWNGDTRTTKWQVWSATDEGKSVLEVATRTGFETKIQVTGHVSSVFVQAISNGTVIGESLVVSTVKEVLPYDDSGQIEVQDGTQWGVPEPLLGSISD